MLGFLCFSLVLYRNYNWFTIICVSILLSPCLIVKVDSILHFSGNIGFD